MADKASTRNQRFSREKILLSRELRHRQTEAEEKLWQQLRGHRLSGYKFRRQQIIRGFIVDFFNAKTGLVIEIDGGIHNQTHGYDQEREDDLISSGFCVLRFSNEAILKTQQQVLDEIEKKLVELDCSSSLS